MANITQHYTNLTKPTILKYTTNIKWTQRQYKYNDIEQSTNTWPRKEKKQPTQTIILNRNLWITNIYKQTH